MFTFDWFHRGGLDKLQSAARQRCAEHKFSDEAGGADGSSELGDYMSGLETRTIIYMKDGLTYEVRAIIDLDSTAGLVFECVPVDENYRVGAIVIVAPFEDIARVEIFAVHPDEKPQESFKIPGFRAATEAGRD
jgi:hypothetical protein